MLLTTENIILIGALLLLVSVFAGKVAYRFGAPALLLFLGVGMLFGLRLISFNSAPVAQFVGMVALCIILFSGGMDTRYRAIRPVIGPGVVLATVGVALTALIVAGFVYVVAPWCNAEMSFLLALLFAATMSSTDSASVFSILRSKKQGLKQHLRPLLELESGSNDPMAYMLTILLIGVVTNSQGGGGLGMSALYFVVQLVVGTLSGYLIGRLAVWTINKINLANHSLYSVLLLAFIFFAFAFTDLVKGNGYLAVYLAGLVVGNHKLAQKRSLTVFFDGFTWLMQIVMFLTLGLFVNSDELLRPEVLILGGAVGAFMILVARPVTVFACLLPFRRFTTKARLYVSWVGLRGAVPILFAIYPMMAGVEHAAGLRGQHPGRRPARNLRAAVQRGLPLDDHLASGAGYDRERHGQSAGAGLRGARIGLQRRDARGDEVGADGGRGQREPARQRPYAQGHHPAREYAGDDGLPRRRVFRAAG